MLASSTFRLASPFESFLVLAVLTAACGCSSGTAGTGGGGGGVSDGKLHPKATGVAVAEATACDSLHGALETRVTQLGCTMTLPTCPSFVQLVSGGSCFQFDKGTVDGCAQYFSQSTDCMDLSKRSGNCVFQAIAGSAPKGCQTP